MAITHTNRKGQTYTLYQEQTKTDKPRYYFARTDKIHDEPVMEIPAGSRSAKVSMELSLW